MAALDVDLLLEPLSPDLPCGEDLEYDPDFGEMERAAQPKPEQQVGDSITPSEGPDWKLVKTKASSLLERTKDLRVIVYLTRALLATEGLATFRDGLVVLRRCVEQYWETLYPRLDPEDDNDPTFRVNVLSTLCDREATLQLLRDTALVESRGIGRFGYGDIEAAQEAATAPVVKESTDGAWADSDEVGTETAPTAPSAPTMAVIEAAFTEIELEALQDTAVAVRQSIEEVANLDKLLTQHVGASQAVDMSPLLELLGTIDQVLTEQLERRGVGSELADEATGEGGEAATEGELRLTGTILNRQDAIRALDKVCEYYEHNEPSSPLPLLIRRAQRLATKSFMDIIRDLAPEAAGEAEKMFGRNGAEGATSEAEESSNW